MAWIIETILGVSALNVLLNTIVFILSYATGILTAIAIRNLSKLQLKKYGRAPIIYDSESKLQRLMDFFTKFRVGKSPTMFLIIFMSSVLLALFEISAESGVDSSDFCKSKRLKVKEGLCPNDFNGDGAVMKKVASALYTQQVNWIEKDLVRFPIRQGFRKAFDGREAFGATLLNKSLPIIVRNCSVSSFKIIPSMGAMLTFRNSPSLWSLRLNKIQVGGLDGEALVGEGDVTSNQNYVNSFIVTKATGGLGQKISATMFDYADGKHVIDILMAVYRSGDMNAPMPARNKGRVLQYTLNCEQSTLSSANFALALQIYRSTQLESQVTVHPLQTLAIGKENITVPRPFSAADLVKATIALKATDKQDCEGETFVYTTCGVYDMSALMPVFFVIFVLGVVVLISRWQVHRSNANIEIPTTALAWSRYVWSAIRKDETNIEENAEREVKVDGASPGAEFVLTTSTNGTQDLILRKRT